MNQWDNILHHLIGITAAIEVWPSPTPSSSSSDRGRKKKFSPDANVENGGIGKFRELYTRTIEGQFHSRPSLTNSVKTCSHLF